MYLLTCNTVYLRSELQDRYGGKLTKNMSGTLYEVFSKVMRALVGKKITVPGPFKKCASHLIPVHVLLFAYMHASIYMFFLSPPPSSPFSLCHLLATSFSLSFCLASS